MNPEALRLAHARNDTHGGPGLTTYQRNPARAHEIGAIGEYAIAKRYGFPMPRLRASGGDDGWDFLMYLPHGIVMRIDAKTFRNPNKLLVRVDTVKKAASNVYIMVHCDARDCAHIIGWEFRSVVARAPIGNFALGPNHFIASNRLRPMCDFDRLHAMRIEHV